MIKIVILGTGNVAKHLFEAFLSSTTVDVVQVVGRNKEALQYFNQFTATSSEPSTVMDADVYLISVSDTAVTTISETLKHKKGLVVHTAGSVPLNILSKHHNYGVLYPLQTFTKGKDVDLSKVPFCIEASNAEGLETLHQLASGISNKVFEISTQQRESLHLAAVFVNNFTNHIYHIGSELCKENNVPFDVLKPLILETSNKIISLSPFDAQTGPARRNDNETIEKHINQLENKKYKELYTLLSESIKKTYGKEL